LNVRALLTIVTGLAGAGLLAGLGILFFASPDQAARVPAAGLLAAAVLTMTGTIGLLCLQRRRPPDAAGQKPKPIGATIGFAFILVIALILIGFFVTHH